MSRDEAADLAAAYESLFHGRLPGPDTSPWPDADAHINVWCPHRKDRCKIGAVYLTRWGYLWLHVTRSKPNVAIGPRFVIKSGGYAAVAYSLLTYPDGSSRWWSGGGHGFTSGSGCRHWKPSVQKVPFNAEEMFALLEDVRTGRVRRPANYVAPWT